MENSVPQTILTHKIKESMAPGCLSSTIWGGGVILNIYGARAIFLPFFVHQDTQRVASLAQRQWWIFEWKRWIGR